MKNTETTTITTETTTITTETTTPVRGWCVAGFVCRNAHGEALNDTKQWGAGCLSPHCWEGSCPHYEYP